ncbi:MAG TPA: autotransporter outer membrane beta-barrel domain-containing protein, partial [Woeseiaceae bacterium]|nr:autotransporter outer membrane beta-barrel domain-containing protein [Woeseiaceae bacterium]
MQCLVALVLAAALPQSHAQTLNQAVVEQLQFEGGRACGVLLGNDNPDVLVPGSPLFEICTRVQMNADPATSGGGFGATPPSQPSSVEVRLDEDEPEQVRRGFFMSVGYDSIDKQVSPFEDGYDSDVVRFVAGLDTLVGNRWVLGIVADGSEQSGDFFDGGDFETTTYGITGFGSYLIGDASSFDFYAGYAAQSHDRARRATFTDPSAENEDGSEFLPVVGAPVADF